MQAWIIDIMNRFGYLGITLLIAIENIFPPIPSEVILTFSGFMTTQSDMNIWFVIAYATLGSVIGAIALYGIGRLLSPERLGWLIDKWGRVLRVKRQDIQKAENWFNIKGSLTVFFCRFIPIVRSLISIPAGMTKMSMGKFILYTVFGTVIWNTVLVCLGSYTGSNWENIVNYVKMYSEIVLIVLAAAVICFVIWFICKRYYKKNKK